MVSQNILVFGFVPNSTCRKHFQITRRPQSRPAGWVQQGPKLWGFHTLPSLRPLPQSLFQSPGSGKAEVAESKTRHSQAGMKLGRFCHHLTLFPLEFYPNQIMSLKDLF